MSTRVTSASPSTSPSALTSAFTEAMSRLASGVAVVSTRRDDGAPCGLLVSSLCSYSARPPSVLVSIARDARSCQVLADGAEFGVHLLGRGDEALAAVFAGRGEDKFAEAAWSWDGPVPRIAGTCAYLRCAPSAAFGHGDHVVVIGEVVRCDLGGDDPLVYYRRSLGWRLAGEP
ncbi:flavin reductase family protein [Streptomyces sp. PT12]|uniref:flavin reductase family protein n=1 Tax=Streptomyces sp. PT12 TaxID=1510197 RepID=UPI0011BDC1D6|nr:flavin reductase family protein [Streptomyces sp. PT12]